LHRDEEPPRLPDPQIDVPDWVKPFNTMRKERGIGAVEIAQVIGASGTISNIEKWMAEDPIRTPDKLLSLAADLKAVPV
jgi:DNA-binding XRE family transcriptional regulator